jgi:hypothetical protein
MAERLYIYEPVGLDLLPGKWDRYKPAPGTIVRKVQPHGCPRNGTMGHCYVIPADTPPKVTAWGRVIDPAQGGVLVLEASLRRATKADLKEV